MGGNSGGGSSVKVTFLGTLPPLKGLSPYCVPLARALEQEVDLEFLGFHSLYPDFLYPGGTREKGQTSTRKVLRRSRVRQFLTYYNPLSWVWAGLTLQGQVVHAQWWFYGLAAPYAVVLLLAKLRRRRSVITVQNVIPHEQHKLAELLNRSIIWLGDHVIVHHRGEQEILTDRFGVPAERISVIPQGPIKPAPLLGLSRTEARMALNIPQDARVVLYFGNIRGYKGVDDLIEAMGEVVAKDPRAYLIIAGQSWGSSQRYLDAIDKNGLQSQSLLSLDFVPAADVEQFFASADVAVLPYRHFDGQSGVASLTLSFGVPMIVTAVGALPEVAADPSMVVPPGDVPALAGALSKALKDDAFRSSLAARTKEKAKSYGWEEAAAATAEVYRGVLHTTPDRIISTTR